MDVRQLEALLAVAEAGSFTAAADHLHTVQSNVSEHVRQLEAELGVQLLVRGRRGTVPTEFGARVIERARAIRSEIDALHKDLSMLQGLETGHATLGVVGTVSRLLVPMVVAEMRRSAPGLSLRLTEGASERLAGEVAERQLASAVVTEPVSDPRLHVEHLRDEDLVGLVPSFLRPDRREPDPAGGAGARDPDPAAAGQPAARRGRDRRAGRARRAPGPDRGRRRAAHRRPRGRGRRACRSCPRPRSREDHTGVRQLRIAAHASAPARARDRAGRAALAGRPGGARRGAADGARRGSPQPGVGRVARRRSGYLSVGVKRVPTTSRRLGQPDHFEAIDSGERVGILFETDARAARPDQVRRRRRLGFDISLQDTGEEAQRGRERRRAQHDAAQGAVAGRGFGIGPPARMRVGAMLRDVVEHLLARLRVTVRLRELHDRPVRFARHQERLFPLGIAHVDVDRMEACTAHADRARRRGSGP